MSRPLNIDVSHWQPVDPASPYDAVCDRERAAFAHFTVKRAQKIPRTGADAAAIYVGGMMALLQFAYAVHGDDPPDDVRENLHDALDYAWTQCTGMAPSEKPG